MNDDLPKTPCQTRPTQMTKTTHPRMHQMNHTPAVVGYRPDLYQQNGHPPNPPPLPRKQHHEAKPTQNDPTPRTHINHIHSTGCGNSLRSQWPTPTSQSISLLPDSKPVQAIRKLVTPPNENMGPWVISV
ncbi:hypothetical protein BS47DRAFT_1367994 [Hydnum rufescens UP504]|uniref:Uncharacterized protein n=1 Tax=Hydnum rufescens UP504 TaxID=1448309 RepID=A0A9P6DNS5_9AGAM|nr:hypothetical protein BS47DRAFT_1367994 [Hydnum rufescens UP504]